MSPPLPLWRYQSPCVYVCVCVCVCDHWPPTITVSAQAISKTQSSTATFIVLSLSRRCRQFLYGIIIWRSVLFSTRMRNQWRRSNDNIKDCTTIHAQNRPQWSKQVPVYGFDLPSAKSQSKSQSLLASLIALSQLQSKSISLQINYQY